LLSLDQEIEEKGGFFAYPSDFIDLHCLQFPDNGFYVAGSSNGLVCLVDDIYDVYCHNFGLFVMWNPSIQKAISLPEPNIISLPERNSIEFLGFEYERNSTQCLGFGYDPKTDDYKLVRLVYRFDYIVPPLVEIYTLRTGAWRSLKAPGPPYTIITWSLSVFLNGAVHWPAYTPADQGAFRNLIVSFDMEDETFCEVAMPKSLQGVEDLKFDVVVLDGLLALVPCNKYGSVEFHSVWVMKEYGVAESWTKLYDIDVGEGLHRVIGFTKNGEALLIKHKKLFSYSPCTQQTLDLHICGNSFFFSLDTYVESLVPVSIADGVMRN
jgi:F-box interacting protein